VVRKQNPKIVIFRIGPQPAPVQGESETISEGAADFTAGFFSIQLDRPSGAFSAASGFTGLRTDDSQGAGKSEGSDRLNDRSLSLGPWIFGGEAWEMRIQHRSGSLAAAVSAGRRRNLAVSFGILILLCASFISIVISIRRAHSLVQRQIEFVAAVSHELRTPLAVISTAAQNLADGIVEGKQQTREYGTHIGTESMRLGNMIEKILEFARGQSRAGALHLAPVRIRNLVDNALSAVQQQVLAGGFEIMTEIQSDLSNLLGDELSLRRALQNLLDNAMKYSGGSRRIRLTAQGQQGRKRTEILVSVQDYGMGIPKEELTLVFDPFFRGKEAVSNNINGSGLGLSLVKSIVSAHRGRMFIDSRPGEGTTISLVLPAAPPEENSVARSRT
jgi:signal transduction histidine kinase